MHEYRVWLKPNQISPFLANILFKTPENQRFFGVFRGYKMGALAETGLSLTRNVIAAPVLENSERRKYFLK